MKELREKIESLTIFRDFLKDEVFDALYKALSSRNNINLYSDFVSKLYSANGGNLGEYLKSLCENSENVYVRLIAKGESVPRCIEDSVRRELLILEEVSKLTADDFIDDKSSVSHFCSDKVNIIDSYFERTKNIGKCGYGIFAKYGMFYIGTDGKTVPVKNRD